MINWTKNDDDIGVIIGNFDGFHLGHKTLVNNFIEECYKKNIKPVAVTFSPHPHLYFHEKEVDFLLTSSENKKEALEKAKIFYVHTIQFSKSLQEMTAKDFLLNYIFSCKKIKYIHLGHDFRLGHGKIDAKNILVTLAAKYQVEVGYEPPCLFENQIISSSKIRDLLKKDLILANKYLSRNYGLCGVVTNGKGIGTKELLPTANLQYESQRRIPSNGVYVTQTLMDGKFYESVTNIGINPTISDDHESPKKINVETYLLYFEGDIYQKKIEVFFIKKIRDEKKFDSFLDLKNQIFLDVENAKNYFRKKSPYKLALIGKNISHSKSQMIYEKIFKKSVNYTLLDYQQENEITSAANLLDIYQGVSITAPYKEHFAHLRKKLTSSQAVVNTLFKEQNKIYAANTDALAILDILRNYQTIGIEKVFLLGDGCMAQITVEILKNLKLSYQIFSRKNEKLSCIADTIYNVEKITPLRNVLVINTCARVYSYDGPRNREYHFWDMNYTLSHHIEYFKNSEVLYQDGMELLELQAKYAIKLWNLN